MLLSGFIAKWWASAWPSSHILQVRKQRCSVLVTGSPGETCVHERGLAPGCHDGHSGVWRKPDSEQMTFFPGLRARGGPAFGCPSRLLQGPAHMELPLPGSLPRPPPSFSSSLNSIPLRDRRDHRLVCITYSPCDLSRQASLLAEPQFPQPLNGASSPCLKGNPFKALS